MADDHLCLSCSWVSVKGRKVYRYCPTCFEWSQKLAHRDAQIARVREVCERTRDNLSGGSYANGWRMCAKRVLAALDGEES